MCCAQKYFNVSSVGMPSLSWSDSAATILPSASATRRTGSWISRSTSGSRWEAAIVTVAMSLLLCFLWPQGFDWAGLLDRSLGPPLLPTVEVGILDQKSFSNRKTLQLLTYCIVFFSQFPELQWRYQLRPVSPRHERAARRDQRLGRGLLSRPNIVRNKPYKSMPYQNRPFQAIPEPDHTISWAT